MVTVYTLYDSEGKLVRRVGYQTSHANRMIFLSKAIPMVREFVKEADKTHPNGTIKIEYFDDNGELILNAGDLRHHLGEENI